MITFQKYTVILGVKAIEATPTSDNEGKHYCIIPQDRWEEIHCSLEKAFSDKISVIGDGSYAEQCKNKFGVYHLVRNDQQLTGKVHQMSDKIKNCILQTDA